MHYWETNKSKSPCVSNRILYDFVVVVMWIAQTIISGKIMQDRFKLLLRVGTISKWFVHCRTRHIRYAHIWNLSSYFYFLVEITA